MADYDINLLSLLQPDYPSLPITVVIKVIKKFDNDEEKCRQALNSEVDFRRNNSDSETSPTVLRNTNICNNSESPSDRKLVASRIKELQKPHENSSQSRTGNQERHVTTIERSIGNVPRPSEQPKRPLVGQSVSWTVQTADRPSQSTAQSSWTSSGSMATPLTAPPDFTPFFSHSAKDIPNINCTTSGFGAGGVGPRMFGTRPHHISFNSSSASSSPMEQRRPIKVINIPPGSLSGGSVSPAATPPNARHIRMHFGDTGGVCMISAPPSAQQHYGSTPNISQQYISEIRTEGPPAQQLHSSSIVVNTSSHVNNQGPERKLSAGNGGCDSSYSGKLTPNLPLSFSRTGDNQSNCSSSSLFSPGKLSTPIQATSPGITHSKPVFVEIKSDRVPNAQMLNAFNDNNYTPEFYLGTGVRPPPSSSISYMPHQSGPFNSQGSHLNYNIQYGTEFPNAATISQYQQEQMYSQNQKHKMNTGYSSPPVNLYLPTTDTGYSPPTNVVGVYPFIGLPTSQMQTHLYYTQYGPSQGHQSGMHIPKNPSVSIGQQSLGSRSSSLDSEHNFATDYDHRHPHYNAMGSRVSSHSSLSSDSSSSSSARPRSGSLQDDAEYNRALVQHQRSHVQKLLGVMSQHRIILENLRSEVSQMEKNNFEASHVSRNYPSIEDISRLCEKNRQLQTDIQLYMNDIDLYKTGQTPVNKLNPCDQQNFFDNMPTGQQDPRYSRSPDGRASPPRPIPPPRPPPPLPARQRSTDSMQSGVNISSSDIFRVPPVPAAQPVINSGDSEEGEPWSCSACTFSNHPALKKCEMCEMPRVMPHHLAPPIGPPIPPPHQSMSSLPPRLAPGLVGGHHTSASPHSALSHHHHHHAGT